MIAAIIMLLGATYGIQMRGNLIDKSKLIDEELPAESVPGNGSNTTYRLSDDARTAMWAIHEGYLQRALMGANSANSTTPWQSSTNLLSQQARSLRLVHPGSRSLALVLGNPNNDINVWENKLHADDCRGAIWSSSHFADETWPGVEALAELPTGNMGAKEVEGLATNEWQTLFSPIQRLYSISGDCNQVTRQFYNNCNAVGDGAVKLIREDETIYDHWDGAWLLPTNNPALATALEQNSQRLNKSELEALNTILAPCDILCQYADDDFNPLKAMYEFKPNRQRVTRTIGYQAQTNNVASAITVDQMLDVSCQPTTLYFGEPFTNSYSYVAITNNNDNLEWPQVAATPEGGSMETDISAAVLDLTAPGSNIINAVVSAYGEAPPVGYSCTFHLNYYITAQQKAPIALITGLDKDGNVFNGSATTQTHWFGLDRGALGGANITRTVTLSAETLDTTIGAFDTNRSSRLVQEGYMSAEPEEIRQYTQGATTVAYNGENLAGFELAVANPGVNPASSRLTMKSQWQLLLNKLHGDIQSAAGYRINDPASLLPPPPEANNPVTLTGTGMAAMSLANTEPLYRTNWLVRITGPGVECTGVMLGDGTGRNGEGTIIRANYQPLGSGASYDCQMGAALGSWILKLSGYSETRVSPIASYPSGWPDVDGSRSSFQNLYNRYPQYRSGWYARTSKTLEISYAYQSPDDGTPCETIADIQTERRLCNEGPDWYIDCGLNNQTVSGFAVAKEVYNVVPIDNPASGSISFDEDGWHFQGQRFSAQDTVKVGQITIKLDAEEEGQSADIEPTVAPVAGECKMYFIQVLKFAKRAFSNWMNGE